jgi:putative copper export protein
MEALTQFAQWLSETSLSVFIQTHNAWAIPTIQSIHIVAIAIVVGSVFMIDMRVLGFSGQDQTLRDTTDRFAPWMTGALVVLLITGILMVVGEPRRELLATSFWVKMFLVIVGTLIAVAFQISLRKNEREWEESRSNRGSVRSLAIVTLLIWAMIIILGRTIAYDDVWGPWSLGPRL